MEGARVAQRRRFIYDRRLLYSPHRTLTHVCRLVPLLRVATADLSWMVISTMVNVIHLHYHLPHHRCRSDRAARRILTPF